MLLTPFEDYMKASNFHLPYEQQQRRDGQHAEAELEKKRKVENRFQRVDETTVPWLNKDDRIGQKNIKSLNN